MAKFSMPAGSLIYVTASDATEAAQTFARACALHYGTNRVTRGEAKAFAESQGQKWAPATVVKNVAVKVSQVAPLKKADVTEENIREYNQQALRSVLDLSVLMPAAVISELKATKDFNFMTRAEILKAEAERAAAKPARKPKAAKPAAKGKGKSAKGKGKSKKSNVAERVAARLNRKNQTTETKQSTEAAPVETSTEETTEATA